MKAVIVAAGSGKRLRPHTENRPKALIDINGRALLDYSLKALRERGFNQIALVVGYLKNQLFEKYGDEFTFVENGDFASTNNMFSLALAQEFVNGDPFLYLHGDLLYNPKILDVCLENKGDIVLAVDQNKCDEEAMKVRVENGFLVESNKEIPLDQAFGEWIGIIKFSAQGGGLMLDESARLIKEGHRNAYDTLALTNIAKRGQQINICQTDGLDWVEVDFIEDLEKAQKVVWN
jgi:choline kinase